MNAFSTPVASTVRATAVFAPVSIVAFTPSMWNVSVPVSPRFPAFCGVWNFGGAIRRHCILG